jgi:4-hydroxy-tetrahydrodipicolinate synthase
MCTPRLRIALAEDHFMAQTTNARQLTDHKHQLDRRALLRQAAGGLAAATLAMRASRPNAYAAQANPIGPEDFKRRMRGAIVSIPTSFKSDMTIDFEGMERMIKRAKPYGMRIFALTAGNSQYASLKYEEILELTRVVIEAAGSDCIAIAATGPWQIEQTLEYARFAEGAGATALQILRPTDKAEVDDDVKFYQQIARATRLPLVLHGNHPDALLDKLMSIESIAAMKEDVSLEYYIHIQRKYGKRLAIFEGGFEYAYLVGYPYGSPAAYSTLATFAPQISKQFWDAIARDDVHEAYRIVIKYELPLNDRFSHEFWRATLEHFGVASRYLRPPHSSYTDEQMKDVAKFYQQLGLS